MFLPERISVDLVLHYVYNKNRLQGGFSMCTKSELHNVTTAVVQEAKNLLGNKLESVMLFGSYARGDYDDESDIDIMILANINVQEISKFSKKFIDFSCDIDLEYNVVLSLILQDKDTYNKYKSTYPFFKNIEKEGVDLVA